MNTDNWNYYHKIDPIEKRMVRSNMLYTPLVSPDGKTFCMHWDDKSEYQLKHGERYQFPFLIEYFFNKEIENLDFFKGRSWSQEILDIDHSNKKIFFKWYGGTLNNILYSLTDNKSLNQECPGWKTQISNIIKDIYNSGYYKVSLYPHCFYLDDNNSIRTFDMYATFKKDDCFVSIDNLKGMMGEKSKHRFEEAMVGNTINFEVFFKRALETHVVWPDNLFNQIHNDIFK
jgi:hypothetical protein